MPKHGFLNPANFRRSLDEEFGREFAARIRADVEEIDTYHINPKGDPIHILLNGEHWFFSRATKNGAQGPISATVWDLLSDERRTKAETLGADFVHFLKQHAALAPTLAPAPPQLYTVESLLQLNLPPRKSLIEGMLHVGETIAIVGRQKVGKSRIVQQMALSLVNREPFLGMSTPGPATVLMIDLENGLESLSERFKVMGGTRAGDARLYVWCAASLASDLPDASEEGARRLRALVEQVKPDVLVVDPWRLWLAGTDENSASDVVRGLKILAGLRAVRPGLAIVVVHHLRKERYENPKRLLEDPGLWVDAVSGHHALMGHTDSIFGLERQSDEGGNQLIIFGGIARSLEPRTLILEEDETLRFRVAANESAAKQVMTSTQQKIWDCALRLRRFTFTKLLEEADTTNKKAVSKALDVAESHGLLRRDGKAYIVEGGNA